MLSNTNISIKNLAAYCLDYSRLVSGNARLSRSSHVELDNTIVDAKKFLCGDVGTDGNYSFEFELITCIKHDASLPENKKTQQQKDAEKRLERDQKILIVLTEINNKIKTQEYTKKVMLETGFIKFTAEKNNKGFYRQKDDNSAGPETAKDCTFPGAGEHINSATQ